MNNDFIFTEIYNCGPIGAVSLKSYCRYAHKLVHVFGEVDDFKELGNIVNHPFIKPMSIGQDIIDRFKNGHEGTAHLFATICKLHGRNKRIIHFDSDIYFKKESLSEIIKAFDEGFDIIGTRRCYGNNPGRVKGLEDYPDTISTYFMGMNLEKLPDYPIEYLAKMWQGAIHPLGWPILDFGDSVTHTMLNNGAKIKYLDWNKFGSQNSEGKKTNDYKSNLHLDMGSHLAHFGGVGSGYSVHNKMSFPEKSYAEWSLGRYELFCKLFYNENIDYHSPTIYGDDGRWINGSPDEDILELVKQDLSNC